MEMLPTDEAWMDTAACATVDDRVFYPDKGGSADAAVAICRRCPAVDRCLRWALDEHMTDGVLGGLTARQRQKLQAARRATDPRSDRERRWPQLHDRAWLQARVDRGATQPEIAAELGCSRTLVSAVMQELGVVPKRVAERGGGQYRDDPRLVAADPVGSDRDSRAA